MENAGRVDGGVITLAPGQIEYAAPDDIHIPEEPGEYADLQEALTAYGLYRPVIPQWMPEGFVQTHLNVDSVGENGLILFYALYQREEDPLVIQVNIYLKMKPGYMIVSGISKRTKETPFPTKQGASSICLPPTQDDL